MTEINLLPWREQRRSERSRQVMILTAAAWVVSVVLVFLATQIMGARIDNQRERNRYLQLEIDQLQLVVSEIDQLRGKKDALLARMDVIQELQSNRSEIVHLMDDLVRKLPPGVYFESAERKDGVVQLNGMAQSNGRVSSLMRNLDSSEWFANPSLNLVDVANSGSTRVSRFDLKVSQAQSGEQAE
jgi:type IV pilus assembly protein PilN